ncbi:MAG: uroporphyrinogen decarboxylase family protein [Phycisphaerae bacterium]|nr:uroporphyrinogen decarboxylase family protein [Phycisphaerae bacterium]
MLVHRPAIYEHAAALVGLLPRQAAGDATLLFQAHLAAATRYSLTHVVPGMDIYGCDADAWSAASSRPAPATLRELADSPLTPFPVGDQVNVLSAAGQLRAALPADVQVRVPVTGPFSLAAQVVGFEGMLMGLLDDAPAVEAALDRLAGAIEHYVHATGPTGCGVTFFESAASPPLVRPAMFERLVMPRLAKLMAAARRAGADRRQPELIMGGATAPILPLLLKLNPALVVCDPANDPADFLAKCRAASVAMRVNLEPRLRLPEHRIEAHHKLETLARLARGDEPLFVATSITPFDADPQTVLDFTELVEQVNAAG